MPGGAFRTEDNLVVDRSPDGSATVRFKPVSAASTPFAIDDLIDRYQQAVSAGEHHPVLLSGLLILDFLVIHPFADGNGRVARILTSAMLTGHGYTVGRYVSPEQAVAESADAYYHALLESTHGWHDGTADRTRTPVLWQYLQQHRSAQGVRAWSEQRHLIEDAFAEVDNGGGLSGVLADVVPADLRGVGRRVLHLVSLAAHPVKWP